jgi:hypothetical protein
MWSALLFGAAYASTGPFKTTHTTFTYDAMDITDKHIDVVYPVVTNGTTFPFITYAHGFTDEGYSSYPQMLDELASWGYVVAIALACKEGCVQDCQTLLLDPPCYGHYYKQQLKVIDWMKTQTKLPVNMADGVAVVGHSMGGQSAYFSAAYNASTHNIKAAVMHHAFTHTYPPVTNVPFLAFTGTADTTAPPAMAEGIYNVKGDIATRGIINKVGADHHEPTSHYNPKLALYTVAWIKLHLDQTTSSYGMNWKDLMYGTGSSSLCSGGDGAMKQCTVNP